MQHWGEKERERENNEQTVLVLMQQFVELFLQRLEFVLQILAQTATLTQSLTQRRVFLRGALKRTTAQSEKEVMLYGLPFVGETDQAKTCQWLNESHTIHASEAF